MKLNLDFKNEVEDFELITTISKKTKNYNNADEIYRVSFYKIKSKYEDSEISEIRYEKSKLESGINIKQNNYNNLKSLSVSLFMSIIGFYLGTFVQDSEIYKNVFYSIIATVVLIALFNSLGWLFTNSDSVKKDIIIYHAIINALEELIEEKQKLQKATSAKIVKPKKKR